MQAVKHENGQYSVIVDGHVIFTGKKEHAMLYFMRHSTLPAEKVKAVFEYEDTPAV